MRTARLNADVEAGVYDDRLAELIQHGRVAFRLEALDRIARDRVNSDPSIDDVEVYLAYQHLLRTPLELSHVAPDMRTIWMGSARAGACADLEQLPLRVSSWMMPIVG